MGDQGFNRRQFIGTLAATGALAMACNGGGKSAKNLDLPPLLEQAPDGKELKAGLIGCGGRGTGAALNFLSAGPNLKVTALGDVFHDRLESCRKKLEAEKDNVVPEENLFIGFDAYQKVIDSGVDVIILATPPYFRPMMFEAAVKARKHVFMEKPVAVDPVGARSIITTSKQAESLGLNVVTGTQRRHQRDYIATYKQIMDGTIGDIVSVNVYWNQGQLWYRTRKPRWSDMEWMIRDWVNWAWLSGDHIVEQHVHNIDVAYWFTGQHPTSAVGFGGRHRRVTGDQYDFFSIDFSYEDGRHMHSMCRQINGCVNNVSERVQGTKGASNCRNQILKPDGSVAWEYEYPTNEEGESTGNVKISPYVQEHIHLVTAIRNGDQVVEAEQTAVSTLTAIMGRISSYTGKKVTWEEMMNSDLKLGPNEFSFEKRYPDLVTAPVPVPGSEDK